jgi:hypothetical protein
MTSPFAASFKVNVWCVPRTHHSCGLNPSQIDLDRGFFEFAQIGKGQGGRGNL